MVARYKVELVDVATGEVIKTIGADGVVKDIAETLLTMVKRNMNERMTARLVEVEEYEQG